jgi:hypothetical protein
MCLLHERLGDVETVRQRVAAWEAKRNTQQVKINWRFTAEDARIKLKRLHPSIEACIPHEKSSMEEDSPDAKGCNEV